MKPLNKCLTCEKECRGKYCCSNCWNKGNKEKMKESYKKYYNNPNGKWKNKMSKYKKTDKYKVVRKKHRLKERQDKIKYNSRARGNRKREKVCKFCNTKKELEFHHIDYKNDVGFTLCQKCHKELHKKLNYTKVLP